MKGGAPAPYTEILFRSWMRRIESDRYRQVENSDPTKHVVAAGFSVRDAGSTPAASTNFQVGLTCLAALVCGEFEEHFF